MREPKAGGFGRRAALLLPLLPALLPLAGCDDLSDIFFTRKVPLPGRRRDVMAVRHGLDMAPGVPPRAAVPPPTMNADWAQPGGTVAHAMGHLAVANQLGKAWTASIGDGSGYREKILCQPVVAGGRVFTMDSNGLVSAFDASNGHAAWSFDTQAKKDRSTNVGGGIAFDGGVIYASTGRAEMLAIEAGTGKLKWRVPLGVPARSSPTVAENGIYVVTIDQQLIAVSTQDGHKLWSFQATQGDTSVLGAPAPAYSDGLVVAGFGSGDLAALRAASGAVVWTDSLAATGGRTSLADMVSVTGMPVIAGGRVFAIGLGGLLVSNDLPSGRRLWERNVAGSQMPWVAGQTLFILTSDQTAAALDMNSGQVLWLADLPSTKAPDDNTPVAWQGPILAGDRLVFGGSDSRAIAVSPYDGRILGQQKLSGAVAVAPIVAGGTVYVITEDGTLTALR